MREKEMGRASKGKRSKAEGEARGEVIREREMGGVLRESSIFSRVEKRDASFGKEDYY